jgi:hypothetical protein
MAAHRWNQGALPIFFQKQGKKILQDHDHSAELEPEIAQPLRVSFNIVLFF